MNATDMHTSLYRNQQRRIDRAEHPANKDHKLCPNKNIETNQAIVEQPPPKKKKKSNKKKRNTSPISTPFGWEQSSDFEYEQRTDPAHLVGMIYLRRKQRMDHKQAWGWNRKKKACSDCACRLLHGFWRQQVGGGRSPNGHCKWALLGPITMTKPTHFLFK